MGKGQNSVLSGRGRIAVFVLLAAAFGGSRAGVVTQATAEDKALSALAGEWVFVEDRTEGRPLEQMNPPMGSKFSFKVQDGAVILENGHGGGRRDVKVTLDGAITEVAGSRPGEAARYRGSWKDGAFTYEVDFIRAAGGAPQGLIRREFRLTPEGLIVRSNLGSPQEFTSTGLYRHPADIPMPAPAKATIADIAWLEGAWVGTRGATGAISMEERWSPAKGGAMLAVYRTVSRDRMSAFEFLRIVEREGGLVYVAQPGGAPPTEFVLTELTGKKAVFENPRHDYPKKIVYELADDGILTALIGYTKGGTPRKFEFQKEAPKAPAFRS